MFETNHPFISFSNGRVDSSNQPLGVGSLFGRWYVRRKAGQKQGALQKNNSKGTVTTSIYPTLIYNIYIYGNTWMFMSFLFDMFFQLTRFFRWINHQSGTLGGVAATSSRMVPRTDTVKSDPIPYINDCKCFYVSMAVVSFKYYMIAR